MRLWITAEVDMADSPRAGDLEPGLRRTLADVVGVHPDNVAVWSVRVSIEPPGEG